MKIPKSKLKHLIEEQLENLISEGALDMSRWTDEETWAREGLYGQSGRWQHLFRAGTPGAAFAEAVLNDIANDPNAGAPSTQLDPESLKGKLADAVHEWWREQHLADPSNPYHT